MYKHSINGIRQIRNYYSWKRIIAFLTFVCLTYYICFSFSARLKVMQWLSYENQPSANSNDDISFKDPTTTRYTPYIIEVDGSGSGATKGVPTYQHYMFQGSKNEPGVCNLPNLKPFHESIRNFVKTTPQNISCKRNPLFPLIFDTDLVSKLIQVEQPEKFGYHNCCYSQLMYQNRCDNDERFSEECIPIVKNETEIPPSIDFFKISCLNVTRRARKERKEWVVVDMFAFARLANSSGERLKNTRKLREEQEPSFAQRDKLNVVIFGFDGVSHMNFQRIMPESYKFLVNNLEAIGLNGYVKTGDNTYPNMVSILMGLDEKEVENTYWKGNAPKYFDEMPLVWKEFRDEGYATSYGEDSAWMGVFIYAKKGFRVPPVDMYLRPLTRQMSKEIGHAHHGNSNLCYASRMSLHVLMNYMKKTATTMAAVKQKYLQLIWASALYHDYDDLGRIADSDVLNHLKWFFTSATSNNTILILMSDHGSRFSSLRKVNQGQIEERMPFVYFVFPPWFRKKFKSAVENLRKNGNKLTSHFDLHKTLRDFINTTRITDEQIKFRSIELNEELERRNFSRGISLLLPIPRKRSCEDAGIPDRWCVCFRLEPIKPQDNQHVLNAARAGVALINSMLSKPHLLSKCHKLKLESVSNAENLILDFQNETIKEAKKLNKTVLYLINFSTKPGMGLFEGQFRRTLPFGQWQVDGVITRINSYGNQSQCVESHKDRRALKPFCYCRTKNIQ